MLCAGGIGWLGCMGCAGGGAKPLDAETSCRAPHSGQNMLSGGIWAPQELQFMMLPFQSLLKPPFLKGCDELPNQPHDL
mgnify:CR=1 FL=1